MRWVIDETPNLYSLFKTVIGSTFGLCDEECALVASYLTLMTEDAPQRDFPLHEVFNGLRWIVRTSAGYDGAKRRKGGKVHLAVDTLRHLLALCVTVADEQDRTQVSKPAKRLHEETGETVEIAFADQG